MSTEPHREWTDGEPGPKCLGCGTPTIVTIVNAKVILWCFENTDCCGSWWPLTSERPSKWPNLSTAEMDLLIKTG